MAQHDYVIANGTGAAVRSDLNDALAAIVSQNSGTTEPATTYAYQWWVDTTAGLLKLRNGANNAWITLRQLDGDFTTVSVDNGSNSAPSIYFNASGTDTGIYSSGTDAVDITTAGTRRFGVASGGDVTVYGGNVTLNAQGDLRFADSDSSNWVAFQSPATVASNVTWTLPSADGTTGQVLSTDGSGALSWATASATVDKIVEGNTEAEVVDTGADGHFKVTTEGTERLRVDPSGRLLVGTSSSRGGWFNTSGQDPLIQTETTTQDVFSGVQNSNSALAPWILLGKSRGATAGAVTVVQNGDPLGGITFQGADGTQMVEGARIQAYVDGTPGADDLPTRLEFSTTADGASSPTERMRISNDGSIGLFSSSTFGCLYSSVSASAGTSVPTFIGRHSSTGTGNGTESFKVWSNGNVVNTNGSYTTISDAKLKENIVDAGSQWDDFKAIQIRNWNFKTETGHETHRQIGPIAQELEAVCPGLVFETPDRDEDGNETGEVTKGVNQSVLYMKAVKALQEAMERIEQLELEMAEVKAQLS